MSKIATSLVSGNGLVTCASTDKHEDDSGLNCRSATEFGWTVAHLVEEGITPPPTQAAKFQISHLEELRTSFPQFFKSTSD